MALIDALIHNATVMKSPISATFELTGRCNLRCKMCYIHNAACDSDVRKKELTTEQWIRLAEEALKNGTLILLLTGGEPMLRDDFAAIYRACAERGFLISINTNGTLLTDEIFELFREHPPLRMNVSLYGMSEEVYQNLCGDGKAFYRVTENLKKLREMGIGVRINFTATPHNYHQIDSICRFAGQIGAVIQHTAYMFPPMRTEAICEQASRFTAEQAAQVMVDYLRACRDNKDFAAYCRSKVYELPSRPDECGDVSDSVRCRAARASYWITYDGKMLPCGMIPNILADVLSIGFPAAWAKITEDFSAVKMPQGCTSCEEYDRCDVCPAICFAENGSFDEVPKYICDKNNAYRTILNKIAQELE